MTKIKIGIDKINVRNDKIKVGLQMLSWNYQ